MQDFSLEEKKYFLTPVCLVPNGRAHLGHVAGPILKMDVLRRHLLRCGADVCMVSMSDVHESHVPIRAHLNGSTPAVVANRFHDLISVDFKTLNIEFDDFINPLDTSWSDRYESVIRGLLDMIIDSGNAVVRSEPIPHLMQVDSPESSTVSMRPKVGEPVVSGWLKGSCPFCSQPLVGFFCESCGGHFSPAQMSDTSTAHFEGKLGFEDRASLFLELQAGQDVVLQHLRTIMVRPDFFELARRYMEQNGASIRLTVPSPWGIEVHRPDLPANEVIWSYSALLLGCHLVAGERYRELTGTTINPLAINSDVTCILSFGIDNSIPFLVGATGCALAQSHYKPFDGLLVNYFYDLDGSKFSTSRGHVIWAGDIVTLGGADPDLVRAYLCQCNPEFDRVSFDIDGFLVFHNTFGVQLRTVVEDAFARAKSAKGFDDGVWRYLEADFAAQSISLSMETFDLANVFSVIRRWIARFPASTATPEIAATWLAGFALLAAPVMSDLSMWIWSRLQPSQSLTIKSIGAAHKVDQWIQSNEPLPLRDSSLTRTEFNACLPSHLRR
jgi:methionyl-tRNA synthetase